MTKNIRDVRVDDLVRAGLPVEEAIEFEGKLKDLISGFSEIGSSNLDPRELWKQVVCRKLLKPGHPHQLHQLVYYSVYADWDVDANGPPLYWFPSL